MSGHESLILIDPFIKNLRFLKCKHRELLGEGLRDRRKVADYIKNKRRLFYTNLAIAIAIARLGGDACSQSGGGARFIRPSLSSLL